MFARYSTLLHSIARQHRRISSVDIVIDYEKVYS